MLIIAQRGTGSAERARRRHRVHTRDHAQAAWHLSARRRIRRTDSTLCAHRGAFSRTSLRTHARSFDRRLPPTRRRDHPHGRRPVHPPSLTRPSPTPRQPRRALVGFNTRAAFGFTAPVVAGGSARRRGLSPRPRQRAHLGHVRPHATNLNGIAPTSKNPFWYADKSALSCWTIVDYARWATGESRWATGESRWGFHEPVRLRWSVVWSSWSVVWSSEWDDQWSTTDHRCRAVGAAVGRERSQFHAGYVVGADRTGSRAEWTSFAWWQASSVGRFAGNARCRSRCAPDRHRRCKAGRRCAGDCVGTRQHEAG